MSTTIGLANYGEAQERGESELTLAKIARAATELHGGRFLYIYWTEGDVDMVFSFEGRSQEQARKVFQHIEEQTGLRVRVLTAYSEGEKEREIQGKLEIEPV